MKNRSIIGNTRSTLILNTFSVPVPGIFSLEIRRCRSVGTDSSRDGSSIENGFKRESN